jgi:hypothetical protein
MISENRSDTHSPYIPGSGQCEPVDSENIPHPCPASLPRNPRFLSRVRHSRPRTRVYCQTEPPSTPGPRKHTTRLPDSLAARGDEDEETRMPLRCFADVGRRVKERGAAVREGVEVEVDPEAKGQEERVGLTSLAKLLVRLPRPRSTNGGAADEVPPSPGVRARELGLGDDGPAHRGAGPPLRNPMTTSRVTRARGPPLRLGPGDSALATRMPYRRATDGS